ncbi:DnaB-like helicase C-terminal domain-containing protein, partial [Glycomyces tenuis]
MTDRGFTTGLPGLDSAIGHFAEENLITVASPDRADSVTLVINILRHMIFSQGAEALVLLPGKSPQEFRARLRCASTGIPVHRITGRDLSAAESVLLEKHDERMRHAPLTILTPSSVHHDKLDEEILPHGSPDLIVIDSIQDLEFPQPAFNEYGETANLYSRADQVAEASRTLKLLASREGTTVIALARINAIGQRGGQSQRGP